VFSAAPDGRSDLYLYPGADDLVRLPDDESLDVDPSLSPDGRRVVFASDRDGDLDLRVLDVANPKRIDHLTDEPGSDGEPAWSPDGLTIAFSSDRTGPLDVWTMRPDGSDLIDVTVRNLDEDWGAVVVARWNRDRRNRWGR
jgi:TolB protein